MMTVLAVGSSILCSVLVIIDYGPAGSSRHFAARRKGMKEQQMGQWNANAL